MTTSINEFAHDFFQDILNEADADGQLIEPVFFEIFCNFLVDAGDLNTADLVAYRGQPNSGIRVDGYGGDPDDSSGTLSLIISDVQQTPDIGRLTKTEMNKIFQRLEKFLQKALDEKWRNSLEETGPGFGLADLIAQRWGSIAQIRLFLISNRALSERVDGRNAGMIDDRPITYSVWDIKRLHRFATSGQALEEIEIDLERDFSDVLPILPAHLIDSDYQAYLGVIPGQMLAEIYERWGARLLEQNVRVFLQARGNVNKGIRNTLDNASPMFFAYNNGITATAGAIKTEERNGQLVLTHLTNFQIVNGGQTTASIHVAMRNNVDLSRVFVQMKLSIVDPEHTEEVVPKISEYANSQNRVNAADFFSNHPFHVRMESFSRRIYAPSPDGVFRETRWFYERARGQYNDARSLLTQAERKKFDNVHPRSQLFSKTDLAKYFNVWEGKPEKVSLGAQKNFADFAQLIGKAWSANESNFNELFFKETIAKALVFKRMEKIVSDQPWYEGGYRANIVAYAIAKMSHDVTAIKKAVDFLAIWNEQSLSEAMESALAMVAKSVHDVLIYPPSGISNVTEWAKKQACWNRVQDLKIKWPKNFLDELITGEEQKDLKREGRKDQKVLNDIEAQTAVVNAGGEFWQKVLSWGEERKLLSDRDASILKTASRIPVKMPSDKQSLAIIEILSRLQEEGLVMELPSRHQS